jgi:hypothetical protein
VLKVLPGVPCKGSVLTRLGAWFITFSAIARAMASAGLSAAELWRCVENENGKGMLGIRQYE